MRKTFDTITIHTLIRNLLQTKIPGTITKFISNNIKGRKAYTTYRNHTSSQRQFKPGIPQGASFHKHYSTFTMQTHHHPEHRFRSWPTQMTLPSHLHTQARVQQRNTYNHTYIQFCLDKTKQSHIISRQNNMHSVHSRPCRILEQYGPQNKQPCITHGNAPKDYGPYLRPKTHIQHTHSPHLSTSTQDTTHDKSTHSNMMGYTEGDTHGNL